MKLLIIELEKKKKKWLIYPCHRPWRLIGL
jgi:hypothetical protein